MSTNTQPMLTVTESPAIPDAPHSTGEAIIRLFSVTPAAGNRWINNRWLNVLTLATERDAGSTGDPR
jgi:hypothetical protein